MDSFLIKKSKEKTFEEKISNRSHRTQEIFQTVQKSFDQFCRDCYDGRNSREIFDELLLIPEKDRIEPLFDVLQNWIDWNYQKDILTSTLKVYFSKLKVIFHHEGLKMHPQDIKDSIVWKKKIHEELHALQMDEIQKIFSVVKPKKKAFYLVLLSTGARPSEILQVRKKDLDVRLSRVKITIHPEGVKTRSGRSIYLTKEASDHIMPIIEKLNDDDLIFARHKNPLIAEKNESKTFSRYCDTVGFSDRYHSNNYRKITLYSFRSFFFGKCADIHREGYAHKMIGHGGYLPQYDRMSDEKKLEQFIVVEPELTVDQTERYKRESELQSQENSSNTQEIAKLSKMIERLQNYVPKTV